MEAARMKSGWFFGTPMWQEYLDEYAKSRPECLNEWKSSPLANDHDLEDGYLYPGMHFEEHQSQVIDLRIHKWSDVRKSYRGLINQANKRLLYFRQADAYHYMNIHMEAFGQCRNEQTYSIQEQWIKDGYAFCLTSIDGQSGEHAAAALWITYKGCAYYASGPSLQDNVQHAMVWESLFHLKNLGITLVELGQIDGETEKEKNIGKFKAGFGGEAKPFTIVRRV